MVDGDELHERWRRMRRSSFVTATLAGVIALVAWTFAPHRSYLGGGDFRPYDSEATWTSMVFAVASLLLATVCVAASLRMLRIEDSRENMDRRRTQLTPLVIPLGLAVLACGVQWQTWQDAQRAAAGL